MDLEAAAQRIVDQLVAGDVRACLDARDLNPPAVLVRPPVLNYRFGRGGSADWELWAVVPDTGVGPSLKALSALIDQTSTALNGAPVQARPDTVTLADGATVPAYVLTWTGKIPA